MAARVVPRKNIEDERAEIVRQIAGPGARRIELMAELAELDKKLSPLVFKASELGVTTRRLGELVGLTSGSISNWVARERRA